MHEMLMVKMCFSSEGSEIEVSEIEVSEIEVTETPDGIKLSCTDKYQLQGGDGRSVDSLDYRDENTGEYRCVRRAGGEEPEGAKIYVKFRSEFIKTPRLCVLCPFVPVLLHTVSRTDVCSPQ